jgi:hypothetical protein
VDIGVTNWLGEQQLKRYKGGISREEAQGQGNRITRAVQDKFFLLQLSSFLQFGNFKTVLKK